MGFEFQSRQVGGYTDFIAEHQLLIDWMKLYPRQGHLEYLDERVADRDRQAVAYYIRGLGMGYGRRFALVQDRRIVTFNAIESAMPSGERVVKISSIDIPEAFCGQEDKLRTAMLEACQCYTTWNGSNRLSATGIRFEFDEQPWNIIPTKYSRRYWLLAANKLKVSAKPKVLAVWRFLISPLVGGFALSVLIALSLAHAHARIPLLALLLLVAGRVCLQFSRYDEDLVLRHWLIGRTKLKNPLSAFTAISRLMTPRPLNAFKVTLTRPKPSRPDYFTLKVMNTSWYPASYLSISAKEVADLVAPGFSDALRAENKGAIDSTRLRAVFSDLQRRWLLPRQTVVWRVKAKAEFPLEKPVTELVATVAISRRVSGETKHGPQSFRLPVEVLGQ